MKEASDGCYGSGNDAAVSREAGDDGGEDGEVQQTEAAPCSDSKDVLVTVIAASSLAWPGLRPNGSVNMLHL